MHCTPSSPSTSLSILFIDVPKLTLKWATTIKNIQHTHGPDKTSSNIHEKQEWCQAFAADASNPIIMAYMVQIGVTHAVATGLMIIQGVEAYSSQ